MSKERTKPRLGRGLSSLMALSDPVAPEPSAPITSGEAEAVQGNLHPPEASDKGKRDEAGVLEVPVHQVRSNPYQPRREFNEASLTELAASLKSTGLVQPIVVRKLDDGYELIAGERRLRAARMAGFATLPAIIKHVDAPTQAQMALVENIQREDLNPIDRAQAYRALLESLQLTQAELATRLGEDRSSIGHYLRLLDLGTAARDMVRAGKLSMGHAKLLAGVQDQEKQEQLAQLVLDEGLSVRALEQLLLAQEATTSPTAAGNANAAPGSAAHLRDLEQSFTQQLGMRVQIRASSVRGKGKIIIQYQNLDEFDALKDRLGVQTE